MSKVISRLLAYLPLYERKSGVIREIMCAAEQELDSYSEGITDLEKQLSLDTATWGLAILEKELGLKTEMGKPLSERRSVISSKWRGTGKLDALLIKATVDAFTNGNVEVLFPAGIIQITFVSVKGVPTNMDDVYQAVENVKPAHLPVIYIFTYLTWAEFDNYNKAWNAWDALNLTWDEFEKYREAV